MAILTKVKKRSKIGLKTVIFTYFDPSETHGFEKCPKSDNFQYIRVDKTFVPLKMMILGLKWPLKWPLFQDLKSPIFYPFPAGDMFYW